MGAPLKFALACVAGITLVATAFVLSGRYHVTTIGARGNGYVLMVDRFTGAARRCIYTHCEPVPEGAPAPAPARKAVTWGQNDEIVKD